MQPIIPARTSRPRFSGKVSDARVTLENQKKRETAPVCEGESLAFRQSRLEDNRFRCLFWSIVSLLMCPTVVGSASLESLRLNRRAQELQTERKSDTNNLKFVQIQIRVNHFFRNFFSGLFCLALLINLGNAGVYHVKLRKLAREAKNWDATQLKLNTPKEPADKAMCDLLEARVSQACEIYAEQFNTISEEKPAVREELVRIFGKIGNKIVLPWELRQLFEYIAYQKVVFDHKLTGFQSPPPLKKQEYLETVYTLLRTGLVLGTPFRFLSDNPDLPFQQGFNEAMVSQFMASELEVQDEVQTWRPLVEKKLEIEKHLDVARKALTELSLSLVKKDTEIKQLEEAMDVFTRYKAQLEAALNQPLTLESAQPQTHATLLTTLDDSLQATLLQLNATLLAHNSQQAFETEIKNALTP